MREARKVEQSHNPNYLKSTSKMTLSAADDCEEIPIAEIALEIPLKLNCKSVEHYIYFTSLVFTAILYEVFLDSLITMF